MKHLPIYCHQSGFWARFGSPCGSGFKFQMYVKHLRSKELRVDLDRDKAVFILQSVYGSVFFFNGSSHRPIERRKALWEQMESRSSRNEPSLPRSAERHTGIGPKLHLLQGISCLL